jgi:hypothetical protein
MSMKPLCTLTVTDAAYLAGLIDGEGSIAVNRTRTGAAAKGCKRGFAYRSSVTIAMTDLPVLEWVQATTGVGKICTKKVYGAHRKPAWTWAAWSIEASALLQQVLPYLKIKGPQASNLIAFQAAMRQPGSKGLSDDEWRFRERCRDVSQQLNKRGIAA